MNMQVAEAQARLEHNKQYISFLQHQIDIKVARAARQKCQEDEVRPALLLRRVACLQYDVCCCCPLLYIGHCLDLA